MVIGIESADHRYKYRLLVRPPIRLLELQLPYYLLILLAVGGLSYCWRVNLASPLRVLARRWNSSARAISPCACSRAQGRDRRAGPRLRPDGRPDPDAA